MSVTFNTTQQNIVDSNYKKVSWLLTVIDTSNNTHNWSNTETVGMKSTAYNFKINGFNGISTQRSKSEFGVQAPNTLKFNVINKDNTLAHTDFLNGSVKVELLISDGTDKYIIRTWKFNVKKTEPSYQKFTLTCEDYIQQYLTGSYPNTRFIKDIFFGDDIDVDDNVCLPVPFGKAYIPLRSVYIGNAITYNSTTMNVIASSDGARCKIVDSASGLGDFGSNRFITTTGFGVSTANNGTFYCLSASSNTLEFSELAAFTSEVAGSSQTLKQGQRYYALGTTNNTFTINKVRSPREWGLKSEWYSSGYTFTQSIKTNPNSSAYWVFQPIIADADFDGSADSAGLWKQGDMFLDMPTEITRSDTTGITNPGGVIDFFLKDIGIPATHIDETALAAASTTYDSWTLEWNGAHWFKEQRGKVLSKYLNMCHSYIVSNERLELKVKSKTSKKTITKTEVITNQDIGEGTFKYSDIMIDYESDSGYVAWNRTGEAQDKFLKILVPAKGSNKTIIDQEVLPLPFVQDNQHIQVLGTLYYQRKFKKQANISFKGKGKLLGLEPEDVITINHADYGGNYDVLIDSVKINTDCSIDFKCIKYDVALDDWGDLSPDAITVFPDDTENMWTPPVSGPLSAQDLGRKAYDSWGQPWVVVGPSTNEGRYTSIQSALNALGDRSNNGIFIKNGDYRTTGPIWLPYRDVSIVGESRGGVVVNNSSKSDDLGSPFKLFKIPDGSTNTYTFENFTVNSLLAAYTSTPSMFYSSTGKPKININKIDFILKDNNNIVSEAGYTGVNIFASSAILNIGNCYLYKGLKGVHIKGCAAYNMSNCEFEQTMICIDVDAKSGDGVVAGNNMNNIRLQPISIGSTRGPCSISNNNIKTSTSVAHKSAAILGITLSTPGGRVIGNNIKIHSSSTKLSSTIRAINVQRDNFIIANNTIDIKQTSTNKISDSVGSFEGITITQSDDGVINNNNITINISETTRIDRTWGIYLNTCNRCIVSENYINGVNDDTRDYGIEFSQQSDNNQGSDNITYNVGTSIVDNSTNFVTAKNI